MQMSKNVNNDVSMNPPIYNYNRGVELGPTEKQVQLSSRSRNSARDLSGALVTAPSIYCQR